MDWGGRLRAGDGARGTRTPDLLGAIHHPVSAYLARFPCIYAGYKLSDNRRKPADLGSIRLGLGPRAGPWTQTPDGPNADNYLPIVAGGLGNHFPQRPVPLAGSHAR